MLSRDEKLIFSYVFGSYGVNKPMPLSDVDLAFYISQGKDGFEVKMAIMDKITSILRTDEVDIVILNESTLSMCFQVLRTGRLLFSKDENIRLHFIKQIYGMYCDTEPLRKLAAVNLIGKIKEGKFGIRQ